MLLVNALSQCQLVSFILSFIFTYLNHVTLIIAIYCQSPTLPLHQWCLLKITNFIKAKCIYGAIIFDKIQIIKSQQTEFSYPAFMIDFSTSTQLIYRSNIYMTPIYSYKKQQIKLFSTKIFLTDKLNYKITSDMWSKICFIHLFYCPYYHKAALQDFYFCLTFCTKGHTNK